MAQRRGVDVISAIGLVDYGQKPDFRVGNWVSYHMLGASQRGLEDDYILTVVVGGEERFWGDDGFWLESWTEHARKPPRAVASLMSYAIFQDSLPQVRLQSYVRKLVEDLDEHGNPIQTVFRRAPQTLKSRTSLGAAGNWDSDTLGRDTVHTSRGTYDCLKVRIRTAKQTTADSGDSTFSTVIEEIRTVFMTNDVPITHIARTDMELTATREAWLAGRSQDKVATIIERSTGSARLVDFGQGREGRLTPAACRRSLAEQYPPRAGAARAARRTTGSGTPR
jgi:hypothetical protein